MPVVFMAGNANPRSMALILLLLAFFTIMNSLLHTYDDSYDYDDYKEQPTKLLSKKSTHVLACESFGDVLSKLRKSNNEEFRTLNTQSKYENSWFYLMHEQEKTSLVIVQSRVYSDNSYDPYYGIVRKYSVLNESHCSWKREYKHKIPGTIKFAQKTSNGTCLHVVYEQLGEQGLVVKPQVVTICDSSTHLWPIDGNAKITAIKDVGNCLHVARQHDFFEYRTICEKSNTTGTKSTRTLQAHDVIAIHEQDNKIILINEQGGLDDLRKAKSVIDVALNHALSQLAHDDETPVDNVGVSLSIKTIPTDGSQTTKVILRNALRKGVSMLRDSLYFGRPISQQSNSHAVLNLQNGYLLVVSYAPKTRVKLFSYETKFFPARKRLSDIAKTISTVIDMQKNQDLYSVPKIIGVSENGHWVLASSDDEEKLIIGRMEDEYKPYQEITSNDFATSLFQFYGKQKVKKMKIVQAEFIGNNIMVVLEDGRIGTFVLENIKQENHDTDQPLIVEIFEFVLYKWKLALLVGVSVVLFVMNEIRIKKRIEAARQQQQRPHTD